VSRGMTGGTALLVRERERESAHARAGHAAWRCWDERERARVAGPCVLLDRAREEKKELARVADFIFLFKKYE
jgi:hypothetical protein